MIPAEKKSGFTLMELLVVLAIIGILAAIVMGSLSQARVKARNGARVAQLMQYKLALELVRDKESSYPGTSGWQCLGDYDDDLCWTGGTSIGENSALNTSLAPFVSGLPGGDFVANTEGYIYTRLSATSYRFQWFMEGTNNTCPQDSTTTCDYCGVPGAVRLASNDNTYCRYTQL